VGDQIPRLQIELARRDVHDFALLRRRMYDLTRECRFIEPVELAFLLTIVDRLFRTVEHYRRTYGFTWNSAEVEPLDPEAANRLGPTEGQLDNSGWSSCAVGEPPDEHSD